MRQVLQRPTGDSYCYVLTNGGNMRCQKNESTVLSIQSTHTNCMYQLYTGQGSSGDKYRLGDKRLKSISMKEGYCSQFSNYKNNYKIIIKILIYFYIYIINKIYR